MSEPLYVLIKRDLYEAPEHMGYTGIKDLAGAWPLSLAKSATVSVKEVYDPKYQGSYALQADLAPDFTDTCFNDLAISHLRKVISAKDAEIAELRLAAEGLAACHDGFLASSGNMEDAYYKLAKYARPEWDALRAALKVQP